MDVFDIVMKLIGPVYPIGEHNADQIRLQNMKNLTKLVDRLLLEIKYVMPDANHREESMRAIGLYAKNFLKEISDVGVE